MVSHHIQYCIYCVPGYRDTGYPGIRVLSLYVYMQYLWFLYISNVPSCHLHSPTVAQKRACCRSLSALFECFEKGLMVN